MSVLVETISPPEIGELHIELRLSADIRVPAVDARRTVNRHVSHEIGDLLHGETPNLVWRESGAYWRVPVALSAPSKGRIGTVGTVDVDVQTGDAEWNDAVKAALETEAERLAVNAAL